MSIVPSPPPYPPVLELKKHHSAPELRDRLKELNLPHTGTKSDMSLRLVHHYSFLTLADVEEEFTEEQLRKRVHDPDGRMGKKELCDEFLKRLSSSH